MWDDVDRLSSYYFVMGLHLQVYYSIQVNAFLSYLIFKMGYRYTLQNNVICCVHPTI